ncbi:MAG: hypothetical protein AAGA75_05100 [Cyanobacteria bacterium P01_E01_bin.6]
MNSNYPILLDDAHLPRSPTTSLAFPDDNGCKTNRSDPGVYGAALSRSSKDTYS